VRVLYQLLAALLLVGVGPLVISSRKLIQIAQGTLESGILATHAQVVRSTREGVESFLGRVRETLLGMARFQGLSGEDDRRQEQLIPFLDAYGFILGLRVMGPDGRVEADATRTGDAGLWERLGAGELARAAAAAERGETYIGTAAASPEAPAAFLAAAVPVRDDGGRVSGSLVALVSLAELQALVSGMRSGSSVAYVVDRRGVVLAHPDLELVRHGESFADLEIVGYLQGGQTEGSVPFRDRAGREMLGAYAVVPGTGWGVVIQELRAEAYRPLTDMRFWTAVWVVVGALLAVVTGVSFALRISRPIGLFAQKALAISRGDFRGRIALRSLSEIGQLAETFNHMSGQLERYDRNMRELFLATIKSLAAAIDAKDPYTRGHSERVAVFSVAIARELGLEERAIERVQIAALLHDVGKIGIEDAVLRKPAKLTDEEFALIKRHPAMGAAIMAPIRQLKDVIPGMRHHHEALDGTGYPDRLAGGEIPLMARIIAVADTFDAMTSDRLYQKAREDEFVIATLQRLSGQRYDPKIVQAFIAAHARLGRPAAAAPAPAPAGA